MKSILQIALLLVLCAGICLGDSDSTVEDDYEDREERNAQYQRNGGGACICENSYIPFCGSNGVTYSNKCQLQCAQRSIPGLRIHFEGVCARPYVPSSIKNGPRRVGEGGSGINPIYNNGGIRRVGEGGRGINPIYNNGGIRRVGEGGRGINPIYNNGGIRRVGEGGKGINPIYG